jgi:hypothetical protein
MPVLEGEAVDTPPQGQDQESVQIDYLNRRNP